MAVMRKTKQRKIFSRSAGVSANASLKENKTGFPSLIVENVSPQIDGGTFYAKAVTGEPVTVGADIFKEGHDVLGAAVLYRKKTGGKWIEAPMRLLENDRWEGSFAPSENALYVYTVAAWVDRLATWKDWMTRKCEGDSDLKSDVLEGLEILGLLEKTLKNSDRGNLTDFKNRLKATAGKREAVRQIMREPWIQTETERYAVRALETRYDRELELMVDRPRALFGAWYELFPRSQGKDPKKSGTFKDCIGRLEDIRAMGFDIIYLPPIHPIGTTNRKGPNNTLTCDAASPGSPWAIGAKTGGHKAVHPDLGTLDDFRKFVAAARKLGIAIALDFAIQCSPDHPYVKEHPEWFYRLPDGTIRYAENPPKKYQDIYPINFYCEDAKALWQELKSIVDFWIAQGVHIFRVDNPHTKPLRFWKWLIAEVKKDHPDVLFLAEAFTRPKVMKYLAKAGFSQSYTYFTWRNSKRELRDYLEELTQSEMRHYFRPNFFVNTPDILHAYLQDGGTPAFKIRLVLGATLSPTYGIYSGFEFCENTPKEPGSEEYLDSEKYQIRKRDWNAPGNIKEYVGIVNSIRRENPALHTLANLRFLNSCNENMLCYAKSSPDGSNHIIVVVNLDFRNPHDDLVNIPLWEFGLEEWQTYQMKDLITGEKYYWKGQNNYVRLDPAEPAHIFLLKK